MNISYGISNITASAFYNCDSLTSVTIPADKWGATKLIISGVEYVPSS